MTSGNGEVVWSAKYNSFGEATIEVETVENNLRFGGQYKDTETGLHYNRWRYYSPIVGRYFRNDPVGLIEGLNLYIYSKNNPVNHIDPKGLYAIFSPCVDQMIQDTINSAQEKCIPWFPKKSKWKELKGFTKERWENTGKNNIIFGLSGGCTWGKFREGYKQQTITERKLCWRLCKSFNTYIKEGKTTSDLKPFKDTYPIDTDVTPIIWIPVQGVGWRRVCDRDYRSIFLPQKKK